MYVCGGGGDSVKKYFSSHRSLFTAVLFQLVQLYRSNFIIIYFQISQTSWRKKTPN